MKWLDIITNKRLGEENKHHLRMDDRSEFKRDYDRLIFSAPFRRLQNKTQVFPLPGSVFVHNRLTHSLEVASVGMSLGNYVAKELCLKHPSLQNTLFEEIGTIVSAACLAHDLGNPPFGHSGESAIQSYFLEGEGAQLQKLLKPEVWSDITHFEGNANTFRLLTHRFKGRREGGFAMTYTTLASIVKYPSSSNASSKKGKFGFFTEEKDVFQRVANELTIPCLHENGSELRYARHPLVYLVEAADDICYEVMDIEDSHKLKILSFEETQNLLLSFFSSERKAQILQRIEEEELTDKNEIVAYYRANVIGTLISACVKVFVDNEEKILSGTFEGALMKHIDKHLYEAYQHCVRLSIKQIYNSAPVLNVELSGYKIIQTLLHSFVNAALEPQKFYSQQILKQFSEQYDITNEDLNVRIMAVLDYISGMTDLYALNIYQKISGISLPLA
ncbi:dGTP triphosphohydrolase [Hoylesella nanceiensis]|uniref:dGTP triphosphohydrolase n=1 Tax=Hoylesella nanceiensis TaxID=425941 RepID=UPI0027BA3568|nr:dNTP triphosphohydrolase [Hoylesella nanceiensis]